MTAPSRRRSLPSKARLAGEIMALYMQTRWALRNDDLPTTLKKLRDDRMRGGEPLSLIESLRLGHAVSRLLDPLPLDSRCLVRSVVLSALLARRATPSELVIGVRPGEEFLAHAWVEREGEALLPTHAPEFQRLATL